MVCYNMDNKTDFYRPEIEAFDRLLEAVSKTFTLVKVNIMKLIKDLGMVSSKDGKSSSRKGLFHCPTCNTLVEMWVGNGKIAKNCRICSVPSTHRMTNTRIYRIWCAMKHRTTCESGEHYEFYKDKRPPEKWLNFEGFYEDMADGYEDGLEIDRIDNDKPYSKENCRWATRTEQNTNTRLIRKDNKSGYRGVHLDTKKKDWQVIVSVNKVRHYLGLFTDKKEAAIARDDFIIANGLPHQLNFPERKKEW